MDFKYFFLLFWNSTDVPLHIYWMNISLETDSYCTLFFLLKALSINRSQIDLSVWKQKGLEGKYPANIILGTNATNRENAIFRRIGFSYNILLQIKVLPTENIFRELDSRLFICTVYVIFSQLWLHTRGIWLIARYFATYIGSQNNYFAVPFPCNQFETMESCTMDYVCLIFFK